MIQILFLYFFKKKQEFVICFAFLSLYFFRIFFVKSSSIAINIWSWYFYKFDYRLFTVSKKLDLLFFYNNFILVAQFLKTFKKFNNVMLSKCNASENFETNINIMYLIAKDVAIEKKKLKSSSLKIWWMKILSSCLILK